jgi:hypothetical protein
MDNQQTGCRSSEHALALYKDLTYRLFNKFCRSKSYRDALPEFQSIAHCIALIDNVMKTKTEWKHSFTPPLYRGMAIRGRIEDFMKHKDINGNPIFDEHAFSSTSTNPLVAGGFSFFIFKFDIPHDIKYYKYPDNNTENEVLLQRMIRYTLSNRPPEIVTYDSMDSGKFVQQQRTLYHVTISKIPAGTITENISYESFGGKKIKKTYKNKKYIKRTRLNKKIRK